MIPNQFVYLFALIWPTIVWVWLWLRYSRCRKEMVYVGTFWSLASAATSYYWWTQDWWRPETITGTRIGIEDFLLGFIAGGLAAVLYEALFHKRLVRMHRKKREPDGFTLVLLLALLTSWLFWGVHLTSFGAVSISLLVIAIVMFVMRRDLLVNGLTSGVLLLGTTLIPYLLIELLSPGWYAQTYVWNHLSGIRFLGAPIEEFVFWFLAGLVFGPLYEYWKDDRLVSVTS